MEWTEAIEKLLLPPTGLFWLGLAGIALLATRRRRWGVGLLLASIAGLYVLATPLAGDRLLASLDRYPPLAAGGPLPGAPEIECVVILGGGLREGAPEFGGDTVSALTLERLHYGTWLAERTELPLLVTGFTAPVMADVLARRFHHEARWLESESRDTHHNAVFTARLLEAEGIRRVYLVSHYWHLPRAMAAFRHAGLEPMPAPLGLGGGEDGRGLKLLVPRAGPLMIVQLAVHEWGGRIWYRLRYGY